jgi:hypothetical protein
LETQEPQPERSETAENAPVTSAHAAGSQPASYQNPSGADSGQIDSAETGGWFSRLLETPLLLVFLLFLCSIIFVLGAGAAYVLVGPVLTGSTLPTTSVQFTTSTPAGDTSSTSLPSGASIAFMSVQGESGTLVTITGQNWPPNDTVIVRLDDPTGTQSVQPLFANARVASDGTFIASVILPANTAWANLTRVEVTVESADATKRVSAEFSIIRTQGPTPGVPTPPPAPPPPPPFNPPPGSSQPPTPVYIPAPGEWTAEYFANPNLFPPPALITNELGVDFDWGLDAPAPNLPADGFSARWERTYDLDAAIYRFHLFADDGIRLWVNGELLIDEWYPSASREISVDYPAQYRDDYLVTIEYADFTGSATVRFWWERVSGPRPPPPPYFEWRGAYWPNTTLFGDPALVRADPSINFEWGLGSPAPGLPSDNFSVRWVRLVDFEPTTYRFSLTVNDGARLWIDDRLVIDEWREGDTREITQDRAMTAGPHELRVEYFADTGEATVKLRWEKAPIPTPSATPIDFYPDWQAEYWPNPDLFGDPVLMRNDPSIDFNWGFGSPDAALPADNFSARWSRSFTFENGLYRFTAESNDGIRFFLDGGLILNEWSDTATTRTNTFELNLNGRHWLVVEYYERFGEAVARFRWEQINPTQTPTATSTATPTNTLTPTTTPTQSTTPTPTATASPSLTLSPSPAPTGTFTSTATPTNTYTPTSSSTATSTETSTVTATATLTGTSGATLTPTGATPDLTPSPSAESP